MAEENRKPGTGRFTLTEPVVMAHPALITPRRFKDKTGKEKGDPRFSATFLFSPESADLKAIKALFVKIANEKWPGRIAREMAEKKAGQDGASHLSWPITAGDKKADKAKSEGKDRETYRGKVLLSAHSDENHPPRLSGFENGMSVDYEGDARKAAAGKFYAGVLALAQFNFVAYDGDKGDGITTYINMVFTTNKGKRIGTATSAAEVFKGYIGQISNEDPTAGQFDAEALDDEIPF